MEYPKTNRVEFEEKLESFHYEDPYLWLEEQQSGAVKQWTEAQNTYTDRWFDNTQRNRRIAELKEEQTEEECVVCAELGNEVFVVYLDRSGQRTARIMTEEGETVRILRPPSDGDVMTIIPDPEGSGLSVFVMMEKESSQFRFYIYDYRQERPLEEIPDFGEICWGRNQKIWYGALDEEGNFVIRYYDCRNRKSKDVYAIGRFAPYAVLRADNKGKYMIVDCKSEYTTGELLQIDQETLEVCKLSNECDAQFRYIGSVDGRHYIMTDWNAPRGCVLSLEEGKTLKEANVVVPESSNVLLDVFLVGTFLLTCETEGMCARAMLYDLHGIWQKKVSLPSETGTYGNRIGSEHIAAENVCFLHFEAYDTPPCILCFRENQGSFDIWWQKKEERPPLDIEAKQFFVTSRDGEELPVMVVRKKGWKADGKTPVLMTGYGGYRLVQPLAFQDAVVGIKPWKWAAKGGMYICCGLRGGGEYGLYWHEAGCKKNKKNAFNDFIDIGEWLVENGWTSPEKLAICGASNGGLLITAAVTMRPELWACAIASVPHTDMMRFVYDASGPGYATEYGNPLEPEMTEYMYSYSPYHQAGRKNCPPIYLQTGERDPQVPSYHAKKMAAALQYAGKGGPVLLRTLKHGTHDRGTGEEYYCTIAEMQCFLAEMLGLEED